LGGRQLGDLAINPDGSGQVNLTNNPAPDFTPEWSPDGSKIVFYRNLGLAPRQDLDVFVMNADGSGQTNLTKNSGPDDFHPSWSPDGEKIVFGSNRENSLDLYIMNADGTDVTRLTNNSQINFAPAWSPDGKKIAFTSVPRDDDNNRDIHVINVDGGGKRTSPMTTRLMKELTGRRTETRSCLQATATETPMST
jgi:Tol biopolymer transport system component